MIALLQRVARAHVEVAGKAVGAIDHGLLVFVCAEPLDRDTLADKLVAKILKLRIFSDAVGKMNRSVVDVAGGLLIVSQFTLAADVSAGGSTSASLPRPERNTRRWRQACSVPTCRCISSTTDR